MSGAQAVKRISDTFALSDFVASKSASENLAQFLEKIRAR
jgi:hypothetical protein